MSSDNSSERKLERRVATVEEAVKLLTELALRANERMGDLEEAQANSERKIAALADAQIRTEEAIANLTAKMAEHSAQQAHTDQRLDALIDIVREGREGKPPREES